MLFDAQAELRLQTPTHHTAFPLSTLHPNQPSTPTPTIKRASSITLYSTTLNHTSPMTIKNMATETHELIEELVPSGGSQAQYDTIDIRRKKDQSGSRSLKVAFQRTCRVSDNGSTNNLPPDMGEFPLFKVSDYKETLPRAMAARGGYFLPMYREYSIESSHYGSWLTCL